MWSKVRRCAVVAALVAAEAAVPVMAATPVRPAPEPAAPVHGTLLAQAPQFQRRPAPAARPAPVVRPAPAFRQAPVFRAQPGPRQSPVLRPSPFGKPGAPMVVRPVRPFAPGVRPFATPARPFVHGDRRYVRPGGAHWAHRPWRRRSYYGALFGGVVLGTILSVGVAGAAPPPPSDEVCWFWSDPYQTQGYWDYCE